MLRALIRKELLALLRDPHALGALFLMPAAFIVIMSLALQNLYPPPLRQAQISPALCTSVGLPLHPISGLQGNAPFEAVTVLRSVKVSGLYGRLFGPPVEDIIAYGKRLIP